MINLSPFRIPSALLLAAVLAAAGCAGAAPSQTVPGSTSTTGPTQVSGTAPGNTPGITPTQPPAGVSPASPTSPQAANSRIQLLDMLQGKPASFTTQPGSNLTVIASAASYTTTSSTFRLSVSGADGTPASSAYHVANLAAGAEAWPFRSSYSATTPGLLASGAAKGARRLQSVPADSTPRTMGSTDTFWVNGGDSTTAGDHNQTCVLQRVSDHAYFYVDQQAKPITDAQLDSLVTQFETQIYPRETSVFEEPANLPNLANNKLFIVVSPGVDNFGQEKGLMGYFWSRDVLPGSSSASHSNQKKIVFMTDKLFDYPALTSFGTLAHEFQHLINFSHKAVNTNFSVSEDTWLDEGMAMYAMEVAGYGLPAGDKLVAKDLNGFEQAPALYTLTNWADNPHGFAYGQSYLFVRYLADRYGQGVIKELMESSKSGQDSLEVILARHADSFAGFFRAWTIANLINGTALAQGTPYQYKNLDLAANYGGLQLHGFQTTPATSTDLTADLKPWGTAYYSFSSGQPKVWNFNLGDNGASRLLGAALVP